MEWEYKNYTVKVKAGFFKSGKPAKDYIEVLNQMSKYGWELVCAIFYTDIGTIR
jgi:hypothetical protein